MNKKQLEKIKNKLKVVNDKLKNRAKQMGVKDINLISQRHELEFILNKQNINFRLSGTNKYFVAYQCKQFENNLKKYGFGHQQPNHLSYIKPRLPWAAAYPCSAARVYHFNATL